MRSSIPSGSSVMSAAAFLDAASTTSDPPRSQINVSALIAPSRPAPHVAVYGQAVSCPCAGQKRRRTEVSAPSNRQRRCCRQAWLSSDDMTAAMQKGVIGTPRIRFAA